MPESDKNLREDSQELVARSLSSMVGGAWKVKCKESSYSNISQKIEPILLIDPRDNKVCGVRFESVGLTWKHVSQARRSPTRIAQQIWGLLQEVLFEYKLCTENEVPVSSKVLPDLTSLLEGLEESDELKRLINLFLNYYKNALPGADIPEEMGGEDDKTLTKETLERAIGGLDRPDIRSEDLVQIVAEQRMEDVRNALDELLALC